MNRNMNKPESGPVMVVAAASSTGDRGVESGRPGMAFPSELTLFYFLRIG